MATRSRRITSQPFQQDSPESNIKLSIVKKEHQKRDFRDLIDSSDDSEASQKTQRTSSRNKAKDDSLSRVTAAEAVASQLSITIDELTSFNPGSIVKIVMKNFVAYDYCKIFPGANLNMIIGPNGTGKSTVVCAIALGLGGAPALLGRTKELSGFVKHGFSSGHVEITLKGLQPNELISIKREISAENNSSSFFINGDHASTAKVKTAIDRLNIQLNNLCQFLPQDRVVEFAKLNSQQLLKETQRAVGQEKLFLHQMKLVELKEAETKDILRLAQLSDSISHLEQRYEQLERDVERWEEYNKAEKKVKILQVQLPLRKLEEARIAYTDSKELRKEKIREYKSLLQKLNPLKQKLESTYDLEKNALNKSNAYTRKSQDLNRKVLHSLSTVEDLEKSTNEKRTEITEITNRFSKIDKERKQLEAEIASMKAELGDKPTDHKIQEANDKIKALLQTEQQIRSSLREVQDKIQSIKNEGKDSQLLLSRYSSNLAQLEDVKSRRLAFLKRFHNDTAVGLEWLGGHRTEFQEHVFGPVALEVKLLQADCANILESVIAASTLKTYVCQNENDYRLLTKKFNDEQKLRTNATMLNHLRMSDFKSPVDKQTLLKWGFDCYAIDLIEAPPPVLVAMCNVDFIHKIPIAFNKDVDHAAVEASGLIRTYIANGVRYHLTNSRYGNRSVSTTTTRVKPLSKVSLLGTGDSAEMQQQRTKLNEDIDKLNALLNLNENKIRKLAVEEQGLAKKIEMDLQPKIMQFRKTKDEALREIQDWERNNVKLDSKCSRLESIASLMSNRDTIQRKEIDKIQREIAKLAMDRLQLLKNISLVSKEAQENFKDMVQNKVDLFDISRAINELSVEFDQKKESVEAANAEYSRADEAMKKAKEVANECLKQVQEIAAELTSDEQQEASECNNENINAEELQAQLMAARQRLSLFQRHGVSGEVVSDYNNIRGEIMNSKKKVSDIQKTILVTQKEKEKVRGLWEPRLRALVETISFEFGEAMKGLDYLGEIGLVTAPSPNSAANRAASTLATRQYTTRNRQELQSNSARGALNSQQGLSNSQLANRNEINNTNMNVNMNETGNINSANSSSDSSSSNVLAVDDEGFGEWGIEIWVSFRAGEPTVPLTEHRQSGGERAVSTALYLQAIQEAAVKFMNNGGLDGSDDENSSYNDINGGSGDRQQTRKKRGVSFRVVDEVNQGMDQRNERLIHAQIVKTACKPNAPQYFLITPKLLPNLTYHKNMKVHCIFNGEWQPSTFKIEKYLQNRSQMK